MSDAARRRPQDIGDDEVLARVERVAAYARKAFAGEVGTSASRGGLFGGGTLLSDVRRYAPGDDPRFIDWAAYGRLDEVFVRVFEPEEAAPIHVALDRSRSMEAGDATKAAQAALLAVGFAAIGALVLAGASVARLPSGETASFAGRASMLALLRHCRREGEPGTLRLKELAAREASRTVRAPFVIITDAAPPGDLEAALQVRGPRRALVVHVVGRQELEPPERGLVRWIDPETGRARRLLVTKRLRAAYQECLRARFQEVESAVRRARAGYLRVASDTPFDAAVLTALQRGLSATGVLA